MENKVKLNDSDITNINSILGKPCWMIDSTINDKCKYLSFRIELCIITDVSFTFDFDD
jgi:hypothetical protein